MTDRRLLDRFDSVLAEVYRRTVRDCGGEIWEANGVVSWASPVSQVSPAYANGVMRSNRLMSAREVLGITAGFFRARNRGYTVMVRSDDRALRAELETAAVRMIAEYSAMVLDEPPARSEPPEGVEIRRVTNPSAMFDFCSTAAAGPDSGDDLQVLVNRVLRRIQALLGPSKAALVAYEGAAASSCALETLVDGVAFIGWVSTKPDYRERGLAAAVTRAAVAAGFDQGAEMAAVLSPPERLEMFKTIGFKEVGRYRAYVFPPPG